MIPTRKIDRVVVLACYLAVPVQFYLAYQAQFGLFIVFIPVWMFLLLPTLMAMGGETTGYLKSVGTLSWGLMMTVFTLSHMAYLLVFGWYCQSSCRWCWAVVLPRVPHPVQ